MTQFSFLHPGAIETPNAIKEMLLASKLLLHLITGDFTFIYVVC